MNRKQLLKWIENPAILDAKSLADLHQMITDYPYFQTARLLYLLNLKLLKDYRFEQELQRISAYAADRTKLREWVLKTEGTVQHASGDTDGQEELKTSVRNVETSDQLTKLEEEIKLSLQEIEKKKLHLQELIEEKKAIVEGGEHEEEESLIMKGEKHRRPLPKDKLLEDFMVDQNQKATLAENKYDTESAARRSIEENYGILSETLARLVAAQGKREEAIKIYQQLMLKNPQKSAYFAAQIEKLRKET
jgi:hypothetical protein